MTQPKDPRIDAYITQQTPDIQERLTVLREIIRKHLPTSIEDISYKMPAWRLKPGKRAVIYFNVFEKHIGLYAVLSPDKSDLYKQIAPYNTGKGTLRFYHDEPLPVELIDKVIQNHAAQLIK